MGWRRGETVVGWAIPLFYWFRASKISQLSPFLLVALSIPFFSQFLSCSAATPPTQSVSRFSLTPVLAAASFLLPRLSNFATLNSLGPPLFSFRSAAISRSYLLSTPLCLVFWFSLPNLWPSFLFPHQDIPPASSQFSYSLRFCRCLSPYPLAAALFLSLLYGALQP